MDTPAVRYTTTSDGFNIAYMVSGAGRPLVLLPWGLDDICSVWGYGSSWARGLSERFQLIQFDMRGRGMSGHGLPQGFKVTDYDIDLATVVEKLRFDHLVFFANGGFGHAAVRYAVAHPERVDAVVLNCTPISITAFPKSYFQSLSAENWRYFVATNKPRGLEGREGEAWEQRWLNQAAYEDWVISQGSTFESSIEAELPLLRVPALVMHMRGQTMLGPEESINLAALIPDARFILIDGERMTSDATDGLAALDRFMGEIGLSAADGSLEATAGDGAELARSRTAARARLSARQSEVLQLLAQGKTNREIAEALVLSERTVQRHVADIYDRIGVRNRAEATAFELGGTGEPA